MRNFSKLQKSAKLQKYAILLKKRFLCIFIHCGSLRDALGVTKALQRDRLCHVIDFKWFFNCDTRDATASAGSVTQPPHPPLGGWGLSHPSRHDFYSHSALMQRDGKIANFCRNDAGGKTEVPVVTQTGGSNQLSKIFHSKS